jgi:bifunctional UDP-N-acetylglucosamine pyrophosphorylase/glucosamine-1-phosphate N-acetyltransferase
MKQKETKITAVILAGGLGTRMKAEMPKALINILEKPMIYYILTAVLKLNKADNINNINNIRLNRVIVVVGHKGQYVKDYIIKEDSFKKYGVEICFVEQKKYLGTADAAKQALPLLGDTFNINEDKNLLLILPCDTPLIGHKTLSELVEFHYNISFNDISILSFEVDNPFSYGRLIKDDKDFVKDIVEEQELTDYQDSTARFIKEVNSGIYIMNLNLFNHLIHLIKPDNSKKEYYLTDLISISYNNFLKVKSFISYKKEELIGVNSKLELIKCQGIMQKRLINDMIDNGVNFLLTDNIYIGSNVKIEEGAVIYPGCFISGNSEIGKDSIIETGSVIINSKIGQCSTIKSYCVLENAVVCNEASIGPFGRLRPGTVIKDGAKIGNFVEIKNSIIGENSKAPHLSYIGDSEVGKDVNIGAGVITCNYDGFKKHKTVIKDNVFIGSDCQLIAPVVIEKGSYVASGTTVTKDVPEDSLAISRVPQENKKEWVLKRLKVKKNDE